VPDVGKSSPKQQIAVSSNAPSHDLRERETSTAATSSLINIFAIYVEPACRATPPISPKAA
jgi:hypothetical protein